MKRVFKIIGIFILSVVLLMAVFFVKAALTPAVPGRYYEKTETGGEIEAKYLAPGEHPVRYLDEKTEEAFGRYEVYFPKDITDNDHKYPLVIFVNGTGIKGSKYKALFRHLASWGFIVAGNEDEASGDGMSTEMTLQLMLAWNANPDSIFYDKIDTGRIGLSGHSQGGAGVLTAITQTEHKDLYKTAAVLSPAHEELAHGLGWNYVPEQVSVPILLLAGTEGSFEIETVIPPEQLFSLYEKIPAPKAMARRTGAEHGDMLYQADGYVTAWLMWQLQDDADAGKAFTGEDPELLKNPLYQDQKTDLGE